MIRKLFKYLIIPFYSDPVRKIYARNDVNHFTLVEIKMDFLMEIKIEFIIFYLNAYLI